MSVPAHVAIIMDGNGRWASARGLPRIAGHEKGVRALRRLVPAARDMGIQYLTVYAFSTENWKRPSDEVGALIGLMRLYFGRRLKELVNGNIHLRVIGDHRNLSEDMQQLIKTAEEKTAHNTGMTLVIAFSYGSRNEIIKAVQSIAQDVQQGTLKDSDITEDLLSSKLFTGNIPDPDLVIRTSGEQRISNFLLWQVAYSELVFLDVLWPDFTADHLKEALNVYQGRNRRFGAL